MNTPGWEVIKTMRKTGTGLMEVFGMGSITGHQASLAIILELSIILVLTIRGQDSGMTGVLKIN